ncbi:MAG: single-stranded DNA-binding protein [Lachnospiraceae bacterium]|jgi:single-strand DNA-binding protein|nr:single-stranded DNA-binding protein [Lachnospiraceae bacterium]MCR5376416.1 single-stranded DNA-binding protein [Lachnospiraceae bacterium]
MNKIILMGRLTRDPEMRSGNGTQVCRYTLAVDRRFKRDGEPDADFFNCTVFGKSAEFAEKYFRQGTKLLITGRIQSDNYTNKDGQKVYSWQVLVDEQEFAESKNAAAAGSSAPSQPRPNAADAGSGFVDIADGIEEDLPFI